jgi:hypothetical protein
MTQNTRHITGLAPQFRYDLVECERGEDCPKIAKAVYRVGDKHYHKVRVAQ